MFNFNAISIVAISVIIISESKCGIIYETRRIKRLEQRTTSLDFSLLADNRDSEVALFTGYDRIFVGDENAIVRRPSLIYEDYLNKFPDKTSPKGPLHKYGLDVCEALCSEFGFTRSNKPVTELSAKVDCKIPKVQRVIFCQMVVDEGITVDWYLLQGPISKDTDRGRSGVFLSTKDPSQGSVSICDYFEFDYHDGKIRIYSFEVIYDSFTYFPKSLVLAFYNIVVSVAQSQSSENTIKAEDRQVRRALPNAKEHRENFSPLLSTESKLTSSSDKFKAPNPRETRLEKRSNLRINVQPDQSASQNLKIKENLKKADVSPKLQASGKNPKFKYGTSDASKNVSPSSPIPRAPFSPAKSASPNRKKNADAPNIQSVKSSTSGHSPKFKASHSQSNVIPSSPKARVSSSPKRPQLTVNKTSSALPRTPAQKSTTIENDPFLKQSSSQKSAKEILQKGPAKVLPKNQLNRNSSDVDFRLEGLLEYVKQYHMPENSEELKGTNSASSPKSTRYETIKFADDCKNTNGSKGNKLEDRKDPKTIKLRSDISQKFPTCVKNYFMSDSYSKTDRKKIQLFTLNIEEAIEKWDERETRQRNNVNARRLR